ncbi:MAG: alpha/beta hydrolase [Leptolyngbyaceae cyanobacterium MO_188.B28]|nr:alpha/beta hydrolase [Leptolyngbyaceae cyanobacterium MO_188.B28]
MTSETLSGQTVHLRRGVTLEVAHADGKSPALVFLHGGLGNRYNWRPQYEFAQSQGWEVLSYDLAGHGESSAYNRYSIGRHRRDLTRLLRRFGIRSPVLCCHSYGAPIGLEWSQRHPVAGLVLVAGGTHDLAPWWEIPLMKVLEWGGRHLYHWTWLQNITKAVSTQHEHPTIDRFLNESPVPTNAEPYEALKIFWSYNFFTRRRRQKLNIPVLVISGGQDSMFTKQMGDVLAAVFPQGEHLHLPEAGHLLIAEYPEIVNSAIARFIVKLSH